jgi:hypothetical protein
MILLPDITQRQFGIVDILPEVLGVDVPDGKKKYVITIMGPEGPVKIAFGDARYGQYHDRLGGYSMLDHDDMDRRIEYLERASKIVNSKGEITANDYLSPNFYSIRILW